MLFVQPKPIRKPRVTLRPAPLVLAKVLTVYTLNSGAALWIFSVPVNDAAAAACAQLRIQTPSGWQGASLANQLTDYVFLCSYDSGDLDCNQSWELVEQPAGMDFGNAKLVLPQSGVTVC